MDNDPIRLRTLQCYNLSELVSEEHLYELFLQAGPLQEVKIVNTGSCQIGFVIFQHKVSVDYAKKIFEGTKLFNRQLEFEQSFQTNEQNYGQFRQRQAHVPHHDYRPKSVQRRNDHRY